MIRPDFKEFSRLACTATLVPVAKSISADLLTPVSAFLAVAAGEPDAFLLESVDRGEKIGRYTFLGVRPFLRLESRGDQVTIRDSRVETRVAASRPASKASAPRTRNARIPKIETRTASVFEVIKALLREYRPAQIEGLPPFTAGAVGYCAYDIVRQLENIGDRAKDDLNVPDCILMFFDRVLAFDHLRHQIHIVASADVGTCTSRTGKSGRASKEALRAAYDSSLRDIAQIERKLAAGWKAAAPFNVETRLAADPAAKTKLANSRLKTRARTPKARFLESVRRAQEYIAAGDIFQVVLSQRWDFEPGVAPFDLYRALRTVNPSPYMYFLRFGEGAGVPAREMCGADTLVRAKSSAKAALQLNSSVPLRAPRGSRSSRASSRTLPNKSSTIHILGSSPEMLVRAAGPKLEYRPIAGTHPRGKDEAEDAALEKKMLSDEKERAEHVMLVDLGRNDLGRVSEYGSVKVRDLMYVERYSHVMHIVSALEGCLRPGLDAMDAFAACFPAGTLSGAPKVRAMQIIEELEPARRGIYGGSVLYADFAGNLDSCIAIRTLLMKGKKAYLQAGAGIVADSDPQREFEETENKSRALLRAVEMARGR
ncbi:MAG: anthranilate synthase component I family protein [Terriglobales bacterium]